MTSRTDPRSGLDRVGRRLRATFATTAIACTSALLIGVVAALVRTSRRLDTFGRTDLAVAAALAALEVVLLAGPLGRRVARHGNEAEQAAEQAAAARDFLDAVLDSVDTGVLIVGAGGTIVEVNTAFAAIAGLAPCATTAEVRASGVALRAPGDGSHIALDSLATPETLAADAPARRLQLLRPGGGTVTVLVRARPLRRRDGTIDGAVVSVVDVARLAEQRRQLERRTEQLEAVAAATYAVQRGEDARESVCELARQLTGALAASLFEADDSNGLRCSASTRSELVGFEVDLGRPSVMATAFARSVPVYVGNAAARPDLDADKLAEVENLAGRPVGGAAYVPMGASRDFRGLLVVTYAVVRGATPEEDIGALSDGRRHGPHGRRRGATPEEDLGALSVLAAQAGIAVEREDLLRRLESEATTDALTRLGNRRSWERALVRAVERSRRRDSPLAAAMLDLDLFKQYNDRYGHLAGDALLRSAAGAWSARLRDVDVLCRIGGEEFGLLLPDCDLSTARRLVERLRAATPDGETCSAGVALLEPGESGAGLVARVDSLLYDAKRGGRDRTASAAPGLPGPGAAAGSVPQASPPGITTPTGQLTPVPPSPQ